MPADPTDPFRLLTAQIPLEGLPYRRKTEDTIGVELPEGPVHVRPGAPVRDLDGKVIGRIDSAQVEDGCLYVETTVVVMPRLDLIHLSIEVPDA